MRVLNDICIDSVELEAARERLPGDFEVIQEPQDDNVYALAQ